MTQNRLKNLSIVIPSKFEVGGIKKIIENAFIYSDDIIVVDGNSNDGTKEICEESNVNFFEDGNTGKGMAMSIGVDKAKYDFVIFYDSDGSHDHHDIPKIYEELINDNDLVLTSRRTGGSHDVDLSFNGLIRSFGCDLLVFLLNTRFKKNFTDILYSFRGMKKDKYISLGLKEVGFIIEQEMIIKAIKQNFKITQIPSREGKRKWGKSKLKTIAGLKFLFKLLLEFIK